MSGWGLSSSGWAVGISVGDNSAGLLWELPNWRVLCSSCLNAFLTFCLTLSFSTSLSYTEKCLSNKISKIQPYDYLSQLKILTYSRKTFLLILYAERNLIAVTRFDIYRNWSETTNFARMVTSYHTSISFN